MKVAMVGAGKIAAQHLGVWKELSGIEVSAVCDMNRNAAVALASSVSARVYDDFEVMLKEEPADIFDICTPPQSHVPLALAVLDSGHHVLLEKPMAMDSAGAAKLLEKQQSSGAQLGVMHNWLFSPVIWRAYEAFKRGEIGEVLAVNIQMVDTDQDDMIADPRHWCHSLQGGRFGESLIHPVYLTQAFLGPTSVVGVTSAKRGRYDWVRSDEVMAVLAGEKGAASIYSSFNAARKMVILEVHGTEGILRVDMISHTLVKLGLREDKRVTKLVDNAKQAAQLLDSSARSAVRFVSGGSLSGHPFYMRLFTEALQTGGPLPVTSEQAYNAVKTLEDICSGIDAASGAPLATR